MDAKHTYGVFYLISLIFARDYKSMWCGGESEPQEKKHIRGVGEWNRAERLSFSKSNVFIE